MAIDFAVLEARAGAAIRAKFRNATATLAAGGAAVDGHYVALPAEAAVGSRGMVARDISFVCAQADATAAGFVVGAQVDVSYRGSVTRWRVDTRVDDVALLDAVLTLRKP